MESDVNDEFRQYSDMQNSEFGVRLPRTANEGATVTDMAIESIWQKKLTVFPVMGLVAIFILPYSAGAQMQTTTAITGTVTDPSGSAVPAANVTVKDQGTGALF